MSETHETPAERRLRELSKAFTEGTPTHDAADAGREAIALLRELHEPDLDEWLHKRRQLLARCGKDA